MVGYVEPITDKHKRGACTRTCLICAALAEDLQTQKLRRARLIVIALVMVFAFLGLLAGSGKAQTVSCPVDMVCITREAGLKALADGDRVKALEAEIKVKDQAYADQKELLNSMRVEFANKSGEVTALKQNAVSDRAVIDLLLKNTKKKCMPFSICF